MNATEEKALLKKTSTITTALTEKSIPPGKYRAAIGFKFTDTDPGFIEYLVCQTMLDVQGYLREHMDIWQTHMDTEIEKPHGKAIFQNDPESGTTRAIVLWKDHRCFDFDVVTSPEIAVALSEIVWISPYEEELMSAQKFVVRAKKQITRGMIKRFEKFLSDGTYVGRSGLLS